MAYVNTNRSIGATFGDRFATMVKSVQEALQRRRVFKQTVRELSGLSSRELNDLGIHRSMITRIASEAAYGK